MSNVVSVGKGGQAVIQQEGNKEKSKEQVKFEVAPVPENIVAAYEQAQFNLRSHEPFLSCILNRMRLAYSPQIDTCAVSIQRRGVVLYLSHWFASLAPSERAFLLKHEALHILHGHIPRSLAYYHMFGSKIHGLLNIAQDIAINPDCRGLLPPGSRLLPLSPKQRAERETKKAALQAAHDACIAAGQPWVPPPLDPNDIIGGQWPEDFNFPEGQSFDWYVKKLIEEAIKDGRIKGKGKGTGDQEGEGDGEYGEGDGKNSGGRATELLDPTQDSWEKWAKENQRSFDRHPVTYDDMQEIEPPTGDAEYDESCKPLADAESSARVNEHILAQAKKEYSEGAGKGVGNQAGEYGELLDKILSPKPISWLNKWRNDLNQLRGGKKLHTWKKPNRRGIPGAKGTKKGPRSRIAVIVDTSGSMGSAELQLGMSEVDILSAKEEVYEIQCDVRVVSARRRKPGDPWQMFGRGGTDLVPAFELAEEEKYSAIICITDGGIFRWPKQPKVPLFWVSVQQNATYPFGTVVHLSPQGNWWDSPLKGKKST